MEQLEIHSRSYLIRWISVKSEQSISWTVRPEKKSINFAIFKHPGSGNFLTPKTVSSTFDGLPSPALNSSYPVDSIQASDVSSKAITKLEATGLKLVRWYGTCEANQVRKGVHDVLPGDGGMYALVFDNTFSKQHSKKVTFVLMTYPTKSPPQTEHYTHQARLPASVSAINLEKPPTSRKDLVRQSSADLLLSTGQPSASHSSQIESTSFPDEQRSSDDTNPDVFAGTLQKRRRRRHQGWARRYFVLSYSTSTLSYFHDKGKSALRGAIPLSLAAVGANAATRQISIDSGAEIWHLKAPSQKEFASWKRALERARFPTDPLSPSIGTTRHSLQPRISIPPVNQEEQREWRRADELVTRLKTSRDLAREIAKDTDPKYLSPQASNPAPAVSRDPSASGSPSEHSLNGYFQDRSRARRPFWKRTASSTEWSMPGTFKRSVSATPSIPTPPADATRDSGIAPIDASLSTSNLPSLGTNVHERCMSLLKDLDSIVAGFDALCRDSKDRRESALTSAVSRHSFESGEDEFFDAEGFSNSQLLDIHHDSDEDVSDRASTTSSSSSFTGTISKRQSMRVSTGDRLQIDPAFPAKAISLDPLPASHVTRRAQVPFPVMSPPSLISFLRKNVGKDLSTISMPVSANEPLSLLQRTAECLEYSNLLDAASLAKSSSDRLLLITTFAISHLSNSRLRERTVRKPFNPLLGETFELVREDRHFRLLAEKVSHHPVQLACQADGLNWSYSHSPMPSQKFWGKSVELITEGKIRVILHTTGERFSWNPATSFLRNVIAGEKYVEPEGSMVVSNETSGETGIVAFKSKGMFSGRSEEVTAHICSAEDNRTPHGLMGNWTSSLAITDHNTVRQSGNPVWTAGELVPDATKRYGFTKFAAQLNEITTLEKEHMAPTDSRLRPDQRAVEVGDLDTAELQKSELEEAQRQRRRHMQDGGTAWTPKWFDKRQANDGDFVYVLKQGADSYWSRRQRSDWSDVIPMFDT